MMTMHSRTKKSSPTFSEDRCSLFQWCKRLNARRIGILLFIIAYMWTVALFGMTINSEEKSNLHTDLERIQKEDENNRNTVREAEVRNKTLILLSSLRSQMDDMTKELKEANNDLSSRIKQLEDEIIKQNKETKNNYAEFFRQINKQDGNIERDTNKTGKSDELSSASKGTKTDCEISNTEAKTYTDCKDKMNYVEQNWKNFECYKRHGVDGSRCSIRKYLSEVEPFCPLMKGRQKMVFDFRPTKPSDSSRPWAKTEHSYSELIKILMSHGPKKNYDWMQKRIESMWDNWSRAISELNLPKRKQKKILVHLGLLTNTPSGRFAEAIGSGGPLGELVQWSDIITTLYLLGHDITVVSDVTDMLKYLSKIQFLFLPCNENDAKIEYVDLIYTDIMGFKQIEKRLESGIFKANRCAFRLIDSFGTEPMFNWASYSKTHNKNSYWGNCNLHPKQFFTLYPHSPDNSFMGFVIKETEWPNQKYSDKKNQVLVYGKQQYMWKGKSNYIDVIHSTGVEVHSTVHLGNKDSKESSVPAFVHNHGLLSTPEVRKVLKDSKIFVGMGFPYEGPAPLEALAEGCIFFNAKFDPPHSSLNTDFFKPKPTTRKLTSQVPYLEKIGRPHVFTINIQDIQSVKEAVREALDYIESGKVKPFIPREFTSTGMLLRVNAYIENQDFCSDPIPVWPPFSDGKVFVGETGTSCIDTCKQHDLICEPAHFPLLNNMEAFKKHFIGDCSSMGSGVNHLYPARHTDLKTCYMQNENMLFSCAGIDVNLERLCPCRSFIKDDSHGIVIEN